MKKIFTLVIAASCLCLVATAQRLLTEDFDYAAGQLTDGGGGANVSGGAWVSFSGTGKYIPVTDLSLSYLNYVTDPAADSRHVSLDSTKTSAEDAYATFATQTSGTVYTSFLLNVLINDNLPLNISDSAEYFVSYLPGTSTSTYFCRLFARQGAAPGTFNLGIAAQAYKSTPISWIATDLALNTTHLVTIGYELIAGPNNDDVAKLWVNSGYSATEPPAQASSVFLVGSEPAEASRLALRQAYGSTTTGATPKCEIDAIKVSTTWADATLPVTLKSFTATSQNGAINLNWVTVNEINMKEYVIERSIDTRNFTAIGTLAAKNSAVENNYSYTDSKALNGTAYYRLKMMDKDGTYRYSTIIPGSAKILQRLMVLGGIVNNNLVISHALATNGAMLKIISLNGAITATQHIQTGASQTIMDVSKLASGNYIAMFINGNEKQTVQFAKR